MESKRDSEKDRKKYRLIVLVMREDITTAIDIERVIRKYYEQILMAINLVIKIN